MTASSVFIKHIACELCGSSDGGALYSDNGTYCHICHKYNCNSEYTKDGKFIPAKSIGKAIMGNTYVTVQSESVKSQNLSDRGITKYTCEAFKVLSDHQRHYYPYFKDNLHTSNKVRNVATKDFHSEGNFKEPELFGQWKFPKGGKYLTITEGELDCLAAYQMMGSKYPVVSLPNGASAALKDCKRNFDYIDSFEHVVLCFDNDRVGKEAQQQVAELLGSKAKCFKHDMDLKDACDYLKNGKVSEFNSLWWAAEDYRPESVVTVGDIFDRLMEPPKEGVPWAFPALTALTYGRRAGELYAFGAGVGIGKTDVFTQQIAYDINVLKEKVGVIYLEQNVVETAQRVAGKIEGKLFHVPNGTWTHDEYVSAIERLRDKQQLYMMEHFGAMDWQSVKSIIRFFAKAYGIRIIYLDHLTALSANEQDERRALDGIMADMASLAQEDGLIINFISHLTTPEGKSHEEGGRVLEKQFTGSRAIARWSHYMFGLERNKQHEDRELRKVTTLRVLKDRQTGQAAGETVMLYYNTDTGLLTEWQEVL